MESSIAEFIVRWLDSEHPRNLVRDPPKWPGIDQSGQIAGPMRSNLAKFGPILFTLARIGPIPDLAWSIFVGFRPTGATKLSLESIKLGPHSTTFDHNWPGIGRIWSGFGQTWTKVVPSSTTCVPPICGRKNRSLDRWLSNEAHIAQSRPQAALRSTAAKRPAWRKERGGGRGGEAACVAQGVGDGVLQGARPRVRPRARRRSGRRGTRSKAKGEAAGRRSRPSAGAAAQVGGAAWEVGRAAQGRRSCPPPHRAAVRGRCSGVCALSTAGGRPTSERRSAG